MNNISDFKNSWNPSAIKIGRATVLPIVFLCFLPSIYLYLFHGVYPPIHTMLQTWGLVLIVFAAFYFIEPLSYYPILGLAGTYMAFLSGNISNMRLPCSAVAQEVVGVKPETPEAQIISTLGISGSIVTNIIAITIAVLIGPYILNLFPEKIIEGFKAYAAPAIFGAVFGQFAFASIRTGIISLLIPSVIYIVGTISGINFILQSWFIITITILLTVTITRILYNKKRKALEEN